MYRDVRERVNRMGGVRGWRARERERRQGMLDFQREWEGEGKGEGGGGEGAGERDGDEDNEEEGGKEEGEEEVGDEDEDEDEVRSAIALSWLLLLAVGTETLMVGRMLGVHDGHDAQKLEYRSRDHRVRQAGAEMGRLKARSDEKCFLGLSPRMDGALELDEHSEWR